MRAVVCSTSLEMGVDYANVDQVLLIGTPRGVSRALQRLGRSGHRAGGVAFGRIVPLSLPDLLEALAMRQAVLAGYIEDLVIPQNPLDVLAQQVVAHVSAHPDCTVDSLATMVRRSACFHELSDDLLRNVLDLLAGRYPSRSEEHTSELQSHHESRMPSSA